MAGRTGIVKKKERKQVLDKNYLYGGWSKDMDEDELAHSEDACDYFKSEHMSEREGYEWKQVAYDPYKYRTFVTVKDEQPILTARKVIIGKEVWAQISTQETDETN